MSENRQMRSARRLRDLRVDPAERPGWVSGIDRPPSAGDRVFTNEGPARVLRVVGKTGASGRLLELSMDDGRAPSFFAGEAQVLVPPAGDPEEAATESAGAEELTEGEAA